MNNNKYYLLIIFNIFFGSFVAFNAVPPVFKYPIPISIGSLLHHYLPSGLAFLIIGLNIYSAYTIFKSKDKEKLFRINLIITLYSVSWFLFMFFGYFFANNILFPIICLTLIGFVFYKLRQISPHVIKILSVTSILVVVLVIMFSFEESYCWGKGDEADPSGSKFVETVTEEDKEIAINSGVQPGMVGVAFLAHMRCHKNFDFYKAVNLK